MNELKDKHPIGNQDSKDKKEQLYDELLELKKSSNGKLILKSIINLIGTAPFAGGVTTAITSFWSDKEQQNINNLFENWNKLQDAEIDYIANLFKNSIAELKQENKELISKNQTLEDALNVKRSSNGEIEQPIVIDGGTF